MTCAASGVTEIPYAPTRIYGDPGRKSVTVDAGGSLPIADDDVSLRIRDAQRGDFRGMDPLYTLLLPVMICWLRGAAHNRRVALSIEDEFVSDLTLKTLDKIEAFELPPSEVWPAFRGWAMSMARLTLLELLRRGRRLPQRIRTSAALQAAVTSVVTALDRATWSAELDVALAGLSAEERELVARHLEGVPLATLAAEVGISASGMRMRFKRLRDVLGERLAKALGEFA